MIEIKYSKISKIVGTDVLDCPNISTRTKGKMIEIKCLKIPDVVGEPLAAPVHQHKNVPPF